MAKSKNIRARILEELRLNPIVRVAVRKAGISPATFYRWVEADPRFAEAVEKAKQMGVDNINDFAESKLIAAIKDDKIQATTFWLKHRHDEYKKRSKKTDTKMLSFVDLIKKFYNRAND